MDTLDITSSTVMATDTQEESDIRLAPAMDSSHGSTPVFVASNTREESDIQPAPMFEDPHSRLVGSNIRDGINTNFTESGEGIEKLSWYSKLKKLSRKLKKPKQFREVKEWDIHPLLGGSYIDPTVIERLEALKGQVSELPIREFEVPIRTEGSVRGRIMHLSSPLLGNLSAGANRHRLSWLETLS
jgi:hypothetical protein